MNDSRPTMLPGLRDAYPVREWIADALEAHGAPHITDRGASAWGTGDLWFKYNGQEYFLSVRRA